jgi:protein O-GlcNAc transferase
MRDAPSISDLIRAGQDEQRAGRLDRAMEQFRRAAELAPGNVEARCNLASALHRSGDLGAAAEALEAALNLAPKFALAWYHLGVIRQEQDRLDEATRCHQKAVDLDPTLAPALNDLGFVLERRKKPGEAAYWYRRAIEACSTFAAAWHNLGVIHQSQRRYDEAAECYEKACELDPNLIAAMNNLGLMRQRQHRFDEAISLLELAIARSPGLAEAHNNLGLAFLGQGRVDEAIASYRKSLQLNPADAVVHSNLLLALHYQRDYDPQAVFAEHLRWANAHAKPLEASIRPHRNDRTPDRRLRIGYVSPDFRRHSVNYFVEPILRSHNHEQLEVFCYADELWSDATTDRLRPYAGQWRNIAGKSDDEVADLIGRDQIDILIDLAGHTGNNRIMLFARKPAPIQVSYLGYPDTSGLPTIDYRLSDAYADPPGVTEDLHTEKLVRLPECAWCYLPPPESPEVTPLPASNAGQVTFGCFNILAKVMPLAIDWWSRILQMLPEARLLLKDRAMTDANAERVRETFAQRGIVAQRLELRPTEPRYEDHLKLYGRLDMVLDPFPYNGTTTTCEALWMGVPVISLAGKSHVSRVGVSLLGNLGLEELIAASPDEYAKIAVRLANDLSRLKAMRAAMRPRMKRSPLCNAVGFTRNLEEAFRGMWRTWCER